MVQQGKIVAFDEVKAKAGKARPSIAAQKPSAKASSKSSAKSTQKPSLKSSSKASPKKTNKRNSVSFKTAVPTKKSTTSKKSVPAKSTVTSKNALDARLGASIKNGPKTKSSSTTKKDVTAKKSTSIRSKISTRGKQTIKNSKLDLEPTTQNALDEESSNSSSEDAPTKKESKFAQARKSRAKEKAAKEFTKQFGDAHTPETSGGPRAAVYKGEMGRQHKKMTQMQGAPKGLNPLRRLSLSGFDWRNSPRFIATVMITVCLFASGAFLYPSAKQYYIAVRERDQLEAEYQAVQERNDTIQVSIDELSTSEGIEDRARQEFGWVKEGENAVNVFGIEKESEEGKYSQSVPSGSVEAPGAWYTPVLDVIFGVK